MKKPEEPQQQRAAYARRLRDIPSREKMIKNDALLQRCSDALNRSGANGKIQTAKLKSPIRCTTLSFALTWTSKFSGSCSGSAAGGILGSRTVPVPEEERLQVCFAASTNLPAAAPPHPILNFILNKLSFDATFRIEPHHLERISLNSSPRPAEYKICAEQLVPIASKNALLSNVRQLPHHPARRPGQQQVVVPHMSLRVPNRAPDDHATASQAQRGRRCHGRRGELEERRLDRWYVTTPHRLLPCRQNVWMGD